MHVNWVTIPKELLLWMFCVVIFSDLDYMYEAINLRLQHNAY